MHWVTGPFRSFMIPQRQGLCQELSAHPSGQRGGGVLIPSPRPVGRVGEALHRARALGTVEKNNEGGKASGAARAVARFRSPSEIIENKYFL